MTHSRLLTIGSLIAFRSGAMAGHHVMEATRDGSQAHQLWFFILVPDDGPTGNRRRTWTDGQMNGRASVNFSLSMFHLVQETLFRSMMCAATGRRISGAFTGRQGRPARSLGRPAVVPMPNRSPTMHLWIGRFGIWWRLPLFFQ